MSGIIMSYIHYVTYHIDVSVRFINLFFQKLIINSDFRRKNSRLFYGQYIAIQWKFGLVFFYPEIEYKIIFAN